MKLGHIEIFVRDVQSSLKFYSDVLGFKKIPNNKANHAWMKLGEVEVLLRTGSNFQPKDEYRASSIALVFYVDDLDKKLSFFADKGLEAVGNDGSDREPTFADPDGNWFQIVDPKDFV